MLQLLKSFTLRLNTYSSSPCVDILLSYSAIIMPVCFAGWYVRCRRKSKERRRAICINRGSLSLWSIQRDIRSPSKHVSNTRAFRTIIGRTQVCEKNLPYVHMRKCLLIRPNSENPQFSKHSRRVRLQYLRKKDKNILGKSKNINWKRTGEYKVKLHSNKAFIFLFSAV